MVNISLKTDIQIYFKFMKWFKRYKEVVNHWGYNNTLELHCINKIKKYLDEISKRDSMANFANEFKEMIDDLPYLNIDV